jgi:hypothetical protein
MAAGMGSRYGGLKQIEPVGPGGEVILDYSVFDALRAGFDRTVFVIRRDIEKPFRDVIGRHFEKRIAVNYVFQELDKLPPGSAVPHGRKKPWGTGHAILMGAETIQGPFGVINADDYYGANSFQMLASHLRTGSPDYAMIGFLLRNTLSEFGKVARGVCQVGQAGILEKVTELTGIERDGPGGKHTDETGHVHSLSGSEIVSMNIWGFQPSLFEHLRRLMAAFLQQHGTDEKAEFYIPTVVNTLVAASQARVRVLSTPDSWFGVTFREDCPHVRQNVRALIAQGVYPERLWT